MKINQKIEELRSLMKERGVDAYIINTADPHQSEYVSDHYKTRVWISGFTGSAGTALVTLDKALLWADGRYFIQAEKQIEDSEFELMKIGIPGYPSMINWLKNNLKAGQVVGINAKTYSESEYEQLKKEFKAYGINISDTEDLISKIWKDRPAESKNKCFILDEKYAGKSAFEKTTILRKELAEKRFDCCVIAGTDDISWLYNIRGNDIDCTPIVTSYSIVTKDEAKLFLDKDKLTDEVSSYLLKNGVTICDYADIIEGVKAIEKKSKIVLDKNKVNRWVFKAIDESCEITDSLDITTSLKAIKNSVEIENTKIAFRKDCVALARYFKWLNDNVSKNTITELDGQNKLLEFRKEEEGFIEPSFDSISAYGPNGAMMHYSALIGENSIIEPKGLYLIDSGGHYYNGTTDITRTLAMGELSEDEKKDFTLTLKGLINLSSARFLYGTTGHALDVLARYPLWQEGIDYKCGTGHGVGFVLGVHEGPHRISPAANNIALKEGMIVSIEPGVYKEGKYGIRIENIVVVKEDIVTDSGTFMKFETFNYLPIEIDAIIVEMLTEAERNWINEYHKKTYELLSPYLNAEENAWLNNKTRAI